MAIHAPTDAEAAALLERLVAIPSPSGKEAAVARAAVETMSAWGFDARVDAVGNAVGSVADAVGQGGRAALLLGHIDTAPGHVPVRRVGDLLYGRGAVDAKGPFAAFICAAARAASLPGALADLRIVVVGAVEEEAATSAGAYHVAAHHPPADAVVIGEPSRWDRITLGYKGRLLVDYRLERPVSHTASQAAAVCETAVDYWLAVRRWAEAHNRDRAGADAGVFSALDPSLRAMRSDSDGLREWVEMRIGLRLPLGLDVDALTAQLTGAWAGEARVTLSGREAPFRADKRNELTGAFLAAIRAEGGRASFVTKTGASDMNVIGPRWGCPIVAYGPGDSAFDHTPDEQIELSEYLRAIRVLTGALQRLSETLRRRG